MARVGEDTAVVILNYNGLEDTLKCLASLSKQTAAGFAVIVVDNASEEDPSRISSEFPQAVLIKRSVNGGWAGGNNTGIREAIIKGARRIILLNNDTVVTEDFVERMALAGAANAEYGIIGPVVRYMEPPHSVMVEACLYNRPGYDGFFEDKAVAELREDPPAVEDADIVNGCCMMIEREVIEEIGLFDERFFLLCEESDYCLRALESGWKCGVLRESLVKHKGGAAFKRSGSSLKSYYDPRNMWLLLTKHSGKAPFGRGFFASAAQYVKTVHHMYCDALEDSASVSAERVVEGVSDAWRGVYGPMPGRRFRVADTGVRVFMKSFYGLYRIKRVFVPSGTKKKNK